MKRYFSIFKNLLSIANEKKINIIWLFLSSALCNVINLLPPIATSGIISMITSNNYSGIWIYAILYIIFYVLYFISLYWNYHSYTVLAEYYHIEVQGLLFKKIVNNNEVTSKISKGKIIETCSDDIRYLVDIVDTVADATTALISLFIIFIIFIYYNALIALSVLILDIIYLKLMNVNSKNVSKYYEGTRKYEDRITDVLNQMLSNIKQIKVLNLLPNLDLNIDKYRKKWKEQYKSKRKHIANRYCLIPGIVYLGKIILYIILAYLVIQKKMKLEQLVLLVSYYEMTISCMNEMLTNLLDLGNYGIRVKRIKTILDIKSKTEVDYGDILNDYINGLVEFKNVIFEVKNNRILNKVSFKAYPNEITSIVGRSGSGKTTIINLLSRIYRIKSGEITIDKESIYNYSNKVYSSNISVVYQKPFVFEMSVKDNLSLVDKNIDNQIQACKRVGIHDYIMSLPKGYNTIINDKDYGLSDGKKQLLAIARSLLSKSEILLFDEISSNIDQATGNDIIRITEDLKKDHTIIMVTHKPEMMQISDRVVVLDKGKVIASGTNKDVYEKCEVYRDLKNRTFASVSINMNNTME